MHGNDIDNKSKYIYISVCRQTHKTMHITVYTIFMLIFQMVLKGIKECHLLQSHKVCTTLTLSLNL